MMAFSSDPSSSSSSFIDSPSSSVRRTSSPYSITTPSSPSAYQHTPFPDVSGLRTDAPGRTGRVQTSSESLVDVLQTVEILEAAEGWQTGTLLAAAWAVLLIHYTHQEEIDIAFQVYTQSALAAFIRVCGPAVATSSTRELCSHISTQLGENSQAHGSQVTTDTLLTLTSNSQVKRDPIEISSEETAVAINVGPERIALRATSRVHSEESASLQLRQLEVFLRSFVDELQASTISNRAQSLSVCDSSRLPYSLRAGDNPSPRQLSLSDDRDLAEELFHHQFERQVRSSPGSIALIFRYDMDLSSPYTIEWSYSELDRRASLLHQEICRLNEMTRDVGDVTIALCLAKSPELYVAQLGTLKAGAAFCPIDPDWPQQRQEALLIKSGARVLLAAGDTVCQSLAAIMPDYMRIMRLDRIDWAAQMSASEEGVQSGGSNPSLAVSARLAYKIWTSGTTGLPKAVGIEHRAAVQALRSLQQVIPHNGTHIRYLQFSAYVFDLSILDCFYTWGLGGTLCSASRELLLGDLVGVANVFKASHSLLTPAVMAMTSRESIPSLQVVINGGEKLTQVVADTWSVECCLLNLYGPAEATLIAMHRRVPANDTIRSPNIGVALPTVSCHALDRQGSVVPKGAIGHLALGGYQSARGYIGDAEKTAERFVELTSLGRVYLTGDLVRQLADGSFEYLGREDDQIKINGIRIETLEISAVIKNAHPHIRDSETQAIMLNEASGQTQIVNFSVLPHTKEGVQQDFLRIDKEAAKAACALRSAARLALPSYMVPSLFLILSYFPRTSSAKIDRSALKNGLKELDISQWEASIARHDAASHDEDPESAASKTEPMIRNIVAELCTIEADRIGRTTPFPSLGLDSIKAMILARRLTSVGLATSVVDIVEHSNLAQLGRKIGKANEVTSSESRVAKGTRLLNEIDGRYRVDVARRLRIETNCIESIAPLTPLQEGMLTETLRDVHQNSYWLNRLYSVASHLVSASVEGAIAEVVRRTPGCRTIFFDVDKLDSRSISGQRYSLLQVVRKDLAASVQVIELSKSSNRHEDELLDAAKRMTGSNPISDGAPLGFVIGHQKDISYLLVRAHHSIYDARSLELLEEMLTHSLAVAGEMTIQPLSMMSALPSILSLTQEEDESRRICWEIALQAVPKPLSISPFPKLSGVDHRETSSTARRFDRTSVRSSVSWAELSQTAQKMGTSARPVAQCAWASVLAAYLQTDCILLGDSVSGRAIGPNMEDVFGPLHATVPVSILITADTTRAKIVDQVDEFHKAVLHHQHVSLSFIRRLLGVHSDQPLFQSVFVFEPVSTQPDRNSILLSSKDLELSVEHPLAIEVSTDEDGKLFLGIVYRLDVISAGAAATMLAQFDASLSAFCSRPGEPPRDWSSPVFGNADLLSISRPRLSEWTDAVHSVSADQWLSRSAVQYPQRTALEFWSSFGRSARPQTISYSELDGRVTAMARFLTQACSPKSIVAVCLPRCVMTYVCLLGVQRAGLTYLPLDENLPIERQQLLVKESGASCVLTNIALSDRFESNSTIVHDVENLDLTRRFADVTSPAEFLPSDLSYVLYTSGSTGKPKACRITRSNLSVTIEAFRLTFDSEVPGSFEDGARFLARSAEAFDVALLEVFLPLRTASTIVTGPRSLILEDLRLAMYSMRVTHAAVVPSLFFSEGNRIRPDQLPDLRALIVGGEQISTDILQLWGGSEIPTLNAYGPTETTIGTSISRVRPDSATSNIGRAFPGSQYVVMIEGNNDNRPALRGEEGELCVLGPQVGDGYLSQSNSAAFTTWQDKRMYRTGDRARMTVDDEVLYLGRIDASQVKVRGARLELGEIDSVLRASVAEHKLHIVTLYFKSEDRLVSFVARQSQVPTPFEAEEVLDASLSDAVNLMWKRARTALPAHMRPSAIVPVASLPLAVISGKIDAQALRDMYERLDPGVDILQLHEGADVNRDLTAEEMLIVEELFCLLPKTAITTTDVRPGHDLFALGLDSLLAVRLAARLRQRKLNVSVSALLSSTSLEDAALRQQDTRGASEDVFSGQDAELWERARQLDLLSENCEAVIPCTPLQESLLAQTLSTYSVQDQDLPYISCIEIDVADAVDEDRLIDAISGTVAANPIWRCCFAEIDGRYCQIVQSQATGALWIGEEEQMKANRLIDDIASVAPVRMSLRRGRTGMRQLVLLVHHALYDGVSLELFLKDTNARYMGDSVPASKPFGYAAAFILGQDEEAARLYWTTHLQDFVLAPFPSLHPLQCDQTSSRKELTLSSSTSHSELANRSRRLGVTTQAILISAWSTLLDQFTGETDSAFGLVLSGRSIHLQDAENIQGPLITTIPFKTATATRGAADPDNRIRNIHRRLLEAYPYQHTSLRKISQWMQVDAPFFNVLFSFLPPSSPQNGSSIFGASNATMQTEYPLAIEVQPQADDTVQLRLAYAPHLIPHDQATLLLQQIDQEIHHLVSNPLNGPRAISDDLFSISNPVPYIPNADDHFLHRFRNQVRRRPHAIAIDYAANGLNEAWHTLTYCQLDSLSNRIAATLLAHPSGGALAVYMHRSLAFYATSLAVWKAGKTYLPLDPNLPIERLKYMLEVAEVKVIATDSACVQAAHSMGDDIILIDHRFDAPEVASVPDADASFDLDATAYILFTSGSTGKPKGVPISHGAFAAAIVSWESILPHHDDSRMLQLASASFDVFMIEIGLPWAFGCAVVSAPKDILLDDLEDTFRKLRVTIADLPASLAPTVHPENVPKLDWLMSGGDAIDERVLREWGSHTLINAWGPTETTIGNALGFVSRDSKRSIVGTAWPGSTIFVLRSNSVEIAYRGCVGELAVAGPQLSSGYLKRPDLTAAAFVSLADGTRVYRTGDRGRMLTDGQIEVLGRVSRGQVKLRGQRLELREVSQAFLSVSQWQLQDADTLFIQHPSLPAKQLITWVALADSKTAKSVTVRSDAVAGQALRDCLREVSRCLPSYMIPSHVLVAQGSLPLTPNNKIDHAALESAFLELDVRNIPTQSLPMSEDDEEQEWSEEETVLRKGVADFCDLPLAAVSRIISFYRLGIDSLSAIRLSRAIRQNSAFAHLSARDILRWPSIALLAANYTSGVDIQRSVESLHQNARSLAKEFDQSTLLLSDDDKILSLLPCTPLQVGTIAQTIATEGRRYFHHHAYRLDRSKLNAVSAAWQRIVDRTDVIRTTFHRHADGAQWFQAVHRVLSTEQTFAVVETETFAQAWEALLSAPLIITEEDFLRPVVKLTLVKCPQEEYIVLSLHHALYDGNALPKLIGDLDDALHGVALRHRLPFHQLVPHLLPGPHDTQHWASQLAGYTPTPLQRRSDATSPTSCDATLTMGVSLPVARSFAQEVGVSLRTVALASFAKALCALTASRDIVFGQIVALRDSIEGADEIIGPAFNTIPTRVRFSATTTVREVLEQVQADSDAGQAHRHASLREVQASLSLTTHPFDALLDYQIQSPEGVLKSLSPAGPAAEPSIQYSINLEFRQKEDHLVLFATADCTVLSQSTLQTLLSKVTTIFTEFLHHPEALTDGPPNELASPSELSSRISPLATPRGSDATAERQQDCVWSELEDKVRAHVMTVVGCAESQLTVDTALLALGVDSVSAIHLASLIRRGGMPVAVADIAKGGSIRELAKRIEQRLQEKEKTGRSQEPPKIWTFDGRTKDLVCSELGVGQDAVEHVIPLLPGQSFQLASWLNSGKRLGIYSWTWLLREHADHARLQKAWEELLERHPILRTTFALVDGNPVQVVLCRNSIDVIVDFTTVAKSMKLEDAGRRRLTQLAATPSDMQRPPVKLQALVQNAESLIVLNLSHALYDAWSIELIAQDLQNLYLGEELCASPAFSAFVEQQTAFTSSEGVVSSTEAFWLREMQAVRPVLLPRTTVSEASEDIMVYVSEASRIARAYEGIRRSTVDRVLPSLQTLLMASWACEVSNLTGSSRPVFGLYHSGRSADFAGMERMAGPCLTVLPMVGKRVVQEQQQHEEEDPRGRCFSLLEQARQFEKDLAARSGLEQSADLPSIVAWTAKANSQSVLLLGEGKGGQTGDQSTTGPLFDTYLNLIWGSRLPKDARDHDSTLPKEGGEDRQENGYFEPVKLGTPSDFTPSLLSYQAQVLGSTKSTIDDLSSTYLDVISRRLEVDVVLQQDADTLAVGIRCQANVFGSEKGDEEVRRLIGRLVWRVEECVASLQASDGQEVGGVGSG